MLKYFIPFFIVVLLILWLIFNFFIIALILSIIILAFSVRIVTPNTVKSVETLWKFNRILRPGLNFIIPLIEWTKHQDLFRKNLTVEVDWITKDNVTVFIWLNVIYYVEDDKNDTVNWTIYKSIYSINDPRTMMSSTIDEQLRAMMSTFNHKEIFWKREEIWESIDERLREKLSQFGYRLDSIQVRSIQLEKSVMAAMNKIVENEKLKEAATSEWEANKILQIKKAEADKESKILLWQGMAGQRMEIAKWFKESVDMIMSSDPSLDWNSILKFLLDSSRIETLWNIWNSDKTKLVYLNEDLEWREMMRSRSDKLIAGSDIMSKKLED